jgi:acylglycerol lipase
VEALKYNFNRNLGGFVFNESYIRGYKGLFLHRVSWMPKKDPRAIIMLVHGLGDHILSFQHLAYYFNCEDIGVVGIDLRGHGKSEGRRGGASYHDLLMDVNELVKYTKKLYPCIPKIFYGHHLGASLVMNYSIRHSASANGIIATSPWIKSYYSPPSLIQIGAALISRMYPSFTISNGISNKYLSKDSSLVLRRIEDPLVHQKISLRLLREANAAGEVILKNKHKFNIPILIMHGTSDKITSWHASAKFSKYTNKKNTTFKSWEGAYHDLHNEPDKEMIFDYILHWAKGLSSVQHVIYGNF